ncbi:MAG TPA: LytTR family DNA-binding domain-containing protein [Blastocatellia bacterium]|nr:LytTR family DNA-binding domain-containing protein [Blastocatellia bacterium]
MKIRTLIVDDESIARDRVRRFLGSEPDIEIAGECGNGLEAVQAIRSLTPDLVFLDIQMPEMNGFEVLKTIGGDNLPAVVFVTAYDQFAIKAFEVHALDYLLKPFNKDRLRRAVRHAREQIKHGRSGSVDDRLLALLQDIKDGQKYLERLVVKSSGRVYFLKTGEIDWVEASGNYVTLHVGRETHLLRDTMNSLEGKLDPAAFLRIHRSRLINIDRIKELHPLFNGDYTVVLRDGTELTMSRTHRDRLLKLVGN